MYITIHVRSSRVNTIIIEREGVVTHQDHCRRFLSIGQGNFSQSVSLMLDDEGFTYGH